MKNTKKIMAIVLAFSLNLCYLIPATTFSASATSVFTGDNFENSTYSNSAWTGGALTIGSETVGSTTNHFFQDSTTNTYTINDSSWVTGNRPTSASIKVKLSSSSANQKVWFGYDKTNGYGVGLTVCTEQNYLMIRNAITGTGVTMDNTSNSGKLCGIVGTSGGNYGQYAYDSWITINAKYEYFNWSSKVVKITYTVSAQAWDKTTNVYGAYSQTPEKTINYKFPSNASDTLNFGLYTTGTSKFDDVVVNSIASTPAIDYSALASAFSITHQSILTKDLTTISASDNSAYTAAQSAYGQLPSKSQKYLLDEKNRLDLLSSILLDLSNSDFASDDFENTTLSGQTWKTEKLSTNSNSVSAVSFATVNNSLRMLSGVHSGDKMITAVADSQWPSDTKRLQTLSFTMNLQTVGGWGQSVNPVVYYDPISKDNISLDYTIVSGQTDSNGNTYVKFRYNNSSNMTAAGTVYIGGNTSGWVFTVNTVVTVSVTYNLLSSTSLQTLTTITDGIHTASTTLTYTKKSTANTAFPLQSFKFGFFSATTSSYPVYVDNVVATFANADATINTAKANAFKTTYANILSKTTLTYDNATDYEALYAAKAEYGLMDKKVKKILTIDGTAAKLNSLLEISVVLYPDFNDNFQGDLSQWENGWKDATTASFRTTTDPTNPSNQVFALSGINGMIIPNDDAWSYKAVPKSISIDIYFTANSPKIYYSYIDDQNYCFLTLGNSNNASATKVTDGVSVTTGWKTLGFTSTSNWLNVAFTFASTSVTISISNSSEKNYTFTGTTFANASKIGLGIGEYTGTSTTSTASNIYYDNITAQLGESTWDVNDKIENIYAYYSGNTFLKPGETATISGENLAATVSTVYIKRLNDAAGTVPGYISEMDYSTLGTDDSAVTKATAVDWDNISSTEMAVTIIQQSNSALKFIIPPELAADGEDAGVYAVKLVPVSSEAEDVIIYINNPEISFTMGDEGDEVSPGGWLRIIGNNLVPTFDKNDIKIVLKNTTIGATWSPSAENIEIIKDDMYSIKVSIPEITTAGNYEVFTYNGYGNSSAWSAPEQVTICTSRRASWSQTVFNVKDTAFGAYGDGLHNDTPAINKALTAAAVNGGGVVYLPKGVYRVISTLVIPENVVLKGDGEYLSQLLWSASHWDYGQLPTTLISITSNVEIKDLGLNGSRVCNIITTNGANDENENIYLENTTIKFYKQSGQITEGGSGGSNTGEMTATEVLLNVLAESEDAEVFSINGKNVQFDNVYYDTDLTNGMQFLSSGSFIQIANSRFNGGWSAIISSEACLFENVDYSRSALNLSGHGIYVSNCNLHDNLGNNRELFTTDGTPFASGVTIRHIGDVVLESQQYPVTDAETLTEIAAAETAYASIPSEINKSYSRLYKFNSNTYTLNKLKGYTVVVTDGQGMGQLRIITWSNGAYFLIDEDFAVSPNRNSTVTINVLRHEWFFVNNSFVNGAGSGTYGTMIDAVFDNNTFSQHIGQVFNAHESPVWYVSVINETLQDSYYTHGEGFGGAATSQTGFSHFNLLFQTASIKNSVKCFLFKNNSMYDESYLSLTFNTSSAQGINDVVVENNYVESDDYGIVAAGNNFSSVDGVLLYNNHFNATSPYSGTLLTNLTSTSNVNSLGEARVKIVNPSDYNNLYCSVSAVSSDAAMGSAAGSCTVTAGSSVTVSATPVSGYEFSGWYLGDVLVCNDSSYTFAVYSNTSLVARFKQPTAKLNVITGNGGAVYLNASPAALMTDYVSMPVVGTSISLSATVNAGHAFKYWKNGDNQLVSTNSTLTATVNSDTTLIAVFEDISVSGVYYVEFLDENNNIITTSNTSSAVTPPTAPGKIDYTFKGYKVQGTDDSQIITDYSNISADKVFVAVYEKK